MIPVWRDVDVIVVGASSGAVAAALEIHRQGRRVLVVSDLSYFGEETAGTLALWDGRLPPKSPCSVKRELESALLQAGVPFLYLIRPVQLLRDEDGRLAGVVLAARTSLLAVTCRAVVDATRYGVVARLAGAPLSRRAELPARLGWIVLSNGVPTGWESRAEELLPPFRYGEATFGAYRLAVERTGDPLAREHGLRASLFAGNIFVTADIIPDVPDVVCGAVLRDTLADTDFSPMQDLFLLNGLLPLRLAGVLALEHRDAQETMGRRTGAMAAVAASRPAGRVVPTQGDFRFAPAFLRESVGSLDACPSDLPVLARCDVAVAGGGTGGAPAGIAAAREGARTVVLEVQHGLGGVGTVGLITSYWYGNRVGFTTELDQEVMRLDPGSRATEGRRWSPEIKSAVYSRMLRDAGGAAWMGSYVFGVRMDGDRVTGLLVSTPFGAGLLETGAVVDATGNADVAAAAGAPCRVIGADHVATQGTGLSPREQPGTRGCNSDHTFVDDTDPEGITHAFAHARAKFPGAFDTSPMVNSRERRQIRGEFEVSPLDIMAQRTFPDTVVIARSDFDTHGFIVHPVFMVAVPDEHRLNAYVPFRCMLPKGVEGVLVTGLGMSAHRDALPVIRMEADVQNQGYAAGMAAAIASRGSRRFRNFDVRALQRRLVAINNLTPDVLNHEDSFPLRPQAIRDAAAGSLTTAMNAAVLLAYPEESRPLLIDVLREGAADRRVDAALILGLTGCREAAPALAEAVRACPWDEGWNYRGMGQAGACMSRLDAMILALARTGDAVGVPAIEEKVRQLDGGARFSHCRIVALAAALLKAPPLAAALADLLRQPGMQGHAQADSAETVRHANGDTVETEARNLALRELYLARGLYLAGDTGGLGRGILENYARDVRGHFARHARAVLDGASLSISPQELA